IALASQRRVDFFAAPLLSFSPPSYSSSKTPLNRPSTEEPVLASSTRFRFQITSSAVNCRPLCHFTSRRRCRVQLFSSSVASHLAPTHGSGAFSHPVTVQKMLTQRPAVGGSTQL